MEHGMIIMFSRPVAQIPNGWALCDGTQGTPDLRDKFIVGAAAGQDPGASGGNVNHNHDFTGDGHNHLIEGGVYISPGIGYHTTVSTGFSTGTTDNEDGRPPYYALCYIMKL